MYTITCARSERSLPFRPAPGHDNSGKKQTSAGNDNGGKRLNLTMRRARGLEGVFVIVFMLVFVNVFVVVFMQ